MYHKQIVSLWVQFGSLANMRLQRSSVRGLHKSPPVFALHLPTVCVCLFVCTLQHLWVHSPPQLRALFAACSWAAKAVSLQQPPPTNGLLCNGRSLPLLDCQPVPKQERGWRDKRRVKDKVERREQPAMSLWLNVVVPDMARQIAFSVLSLPGLAFVSSFHLFATEELLTKYRRVFI